jgi:hypothetical protein
VISAIEEWHAFHAPGDGITADSLVTFAVRPPVIGLMCRDTSGRIWLGWAHSASGRFEVPWTDLGGPFIQGPIVQMVGTEAIVVAVSATGDLQFVALPERYQSTDRLAWQSLSLASSHSPAVVSWGPGRVDVFGLQEDGLLRQTWLERKPDGWTAKGQAVPVAEGVTEMPAPVSWGPLRLDLFGRSASGSVTHKWWDDAADRLDIFTVENTSKTTHKYWHPGTGWLPAPPTQWEDVGGPLTTPPMAVTWGNYHLDIFGRGSEGHLRHLWWGPENGWEPNFDWEDMRGVLGGPPNAFVWGPDRLGVFAVSIENTLIYKYRDPGIFWRPSLTRWHETSFPGSGVPAVQSLRAGIIPNGPAIVSVVEDSLDRAHVGIFRP